MIKGFTLPSVIQKTREAFLACFILILLPTILLKGALFDGKDFVPFDISTFAPFKYQLSDEELEKRRQGANWDLTEKDLVNTPEYRLARDEIIEGRFPHWNPYVRTGAPLLANVLDGFFYPVHWLFFFFDPGRAYGVAAWLAFCIAGLFMFGFLRKIGLESQSALFGAIVFQLSGTVAANAHDFMRMESLCWLPAGFWALLKLWEKEGRERIPSFVAFALCLTMLWFAGFPPFALPISFCFGFFIIFLSWHAFRRQGLRDAATYFTWASAAVVLGLLVASVQLLPMLDYFPDSSRNLSQTTAELAGMSFDPSGLLGFFMPAPFGMSVDNIPYDKNAITYLLYSRSNPETGKLFLPNYNYTEYAVYLGAIPFALVVWSFLGSSVRFRYFAIPVFGFFLVFAMGGWLFQLFNFLPVLRSLPPMRFVCVLCFFGAALAAMGMEVAPRLLSQGKRMLLIASTGVIFLFCLGIFFFCRYWLTDMGRDGTEILAWISELWKGSYPVAASIETVQSFFGANKEKAAETISNAFNQLQAQSLQAAGFFLLLLFWVFTNPGEHRVIRILSFRFGWLLNFFLIAFTAFDLMLPAMRANPSFPHHDLEETSVHAFLRKKRAESQPDGGFMVARVGTKMTLPDAFPPNLLSYLRIRDLNAYAFLDGRSYKPFHRLFGDGILLRKFWLNTLPADERLNHGLLDLFGIRYLLSHEELPSLGPQACPPMRDLDDKAQFFVYERKSALPRAFLVQSVSFEPSDEVALDFLTASDFDPRKAALLHEAIYEPGGKGTARFVSGNTADAERRAKTNKASVRFLEDFPSRIRIEVRDSPGAWLILTDTALPHWTASFDGSPMAIWRANLCFRAVWVDEGDHDVIFAYDAVPFRSGLYLSAIGLALILLSLAWWNGSPRRKVLVEKTDLVQIGQPGTDENEISRNDVED